MSHDHEHTPPEKWRAKLRAEGYRLTPQRELVLRAVEDLGHATPDEVFAEVRRESSAVNISTVYRTLELLERLRLVWHPHLGKGAPVYHTAGHRHRHVACATCGSRGSRRACATSGASAPTSAT